MKKKVLFALIALFSFVGAWALPGNPKVTVSGQDYYFSGAIVVADVATIYQGAAAPVVCESATSTTALGTKQEVFKASYYEADGGLKLTPVTGAPTELGDYFIKVTYASPTKPNYVPFRVVKDLEVTEVNDATSFAAANAENKSYWIYYQKGPWNDVWYESNKPAVGDGQILYPGDVLDNDGNVVTTGRFVRNPDGSYVSATKAQLTEWAETVLEDVRVMHSWKATEVSNPDNVAFAINDGTYDPENDTRRFVVAFIYGDKSGLVKATPADTKPFLYKNWDVDMSTIAAGAANWVTYVNSVLGTEYTTPDQIALTGENKFEAVYFAAQKPYTGLFDYDWTMSPLSGNYDGNAKNPTITAWGYDNNGTQTALKPYGDGEGKSKDAFKAFKVEYFTDAACTKTKKVDEMIAAGTYYVKVSVYTGDIEVPGLTGGDNPTNEPQWMAIGTPKMFVIGATQLTLTLMKLEKNYLDPDPEFIDFGVAGWLYSNPNGQYVPFYTLTDASGAAISTDVARLKGMKFERVDEGEAVYTAEGKAQYVYTIPLSKIHVVTPKGDPEIPATTTSPAKWSEAQWNAIDLKDKTTYDENYTVVNGSMEKLQIVPRNLEDLTLTVDDFVLYNRAEFNQINNMDLEGATRVTDKLNVAGLFFTANDEAQTKIPVDFTQVTVTVTEGADNTNVTRAPSDKLNGEVKQGASLTLTAPSKSNFEGSIDIPFTIEPRPIDEKIEDFELKNGVLVQKEDANGNKVWKDNDLGTWNFTAYSTNLPVYSGKKNIPEVLNTATCTGTKGLKGDNKNLAIVTKNGDGTKFLSGDYYLGEEKQDVDYINANVQPKANGGWEPRVLTADDLETPDDETVLADKARIAVFGVGNFTGVRIVEYDIYPKSINSADITIEVAETTYGEDDYQNPDATVTDGGLLTPDGEAATNKLLTQDTDFTVGQTGADAGAGTVTVNGIGNYCGSAKPASNVKPGTLEIAFTSLKKTYGDEDPEITFTITGWAGDDEYAKDADGKYLGAVDGKPLADGAPAIQRKKSALYDQLVESISYTREEGEDVGYYDIYPDEDNPTQVGNYEITYKDFVEDDLETTEVDETSYPQFYIEKRALTVTANNVTAPYGTVGPDTEWGYTITNFAEGTVNGYTFNDTEESVLAEVAATAGTETAKVVITPSTTTFVKGGPYNLVPSVDPSGVDPDNYKFNFVAGTLTIGDAALEIAAVDMSKTYGAADPTKFEYTITGWLNGDQWKKNADGKYVDKNNSVLEDQNDESKRVASAAYTDLCAQIDAVIKREAGEDVDDYEIYFGEYYPEGDEHEGEIKPTSRPATFQSYALSYEDATFSITQAAITVYALPQTIYYNINGFDIDKTIKVAYDDEPLGDATVRIVGLQNGDDVDDLPTITLKRLGNETAIGVYDPYKIDFTEGIRALVAETANYIINCVDGVLTIDKEQELITLERPFLQGELWNTKPQASDRVYDETAEGNFRFTNTLYTWDAELEDFVEDGEEDIYIPNTADTYLKNFNGAEGVSVGFGDYNFYKDRWYTLVLPFDIEVEDLCTAFGAYVVVDVLNPVNANPNDVYFTNFMHLIPANTPFLIKLNKDKNMENVVFNNVTIKYASPEALAAAAEDYDVEAAIEEVRGTEVKKVLATPLKDRAGNKFIGSYTGAYGLASNETTLSIVSGDKITKYATAYVYPLSAFIQLNSASAADVRIFVEEADGTITAISGVEIAEEGAAQGAAEGWYTITGIKLEGKPATKGTYIYNGKVVYVK